MTDVHAWIRYVDDDPDIDDTWMLYVANGSGAPVGRWRVDLNTDETLDNTDVGPLAPGTFRRGIEPLDAGGEPKVDRLWFEQRDGKVMVRESGDQVRETAWPQND
jgi:hypothetical protein